MDVPGVMILVLATAFTAAVALLCWALLRTGRPALDATLLVFLWVFIVTFDLLALGLAGVMTRSAIAISSALGLVGLGLIPRARHALRESFTVIRSWARLLLAGWGGLPRWLRGVTIVALPLWGHDRVQGVMTLMWREPRPFAEGNRQLLAAIGQQIGVAIDRARLYEDTRRRERQSGNRRRRDCPAVFCP